MQAKKYYSKAAIALCIYLLVNLYIQHVLPHLTADDIWSHTARSAISQFSELKSTPKIVFVGSSVMGRPLWLVDHKYYPSTAPYPSPRQTMRLPNKLAEIAYDKVQAFNFSLDAAMVSDVYLVCDKLFKNTRVPQLVIFGVSRRDVLACLFLSERNTPAFRLLFEPEDCTKLGYLYSTCLKERFELVMVELIPFYRDRQFFQDGIFKWFRLIENSFLKSLIVQNVSTALIESKPNRDSQNKFSAPLAPVTNQGNFCSYTIDKARLKNQEICLGLIANLLASRHSNLLIVNMPLRKDYSAAANESCINYRKTLQTCAKLPNTFLLDLDKANLGFDNGCFEDWFHLNAKGGEKLVVLLAEWLKQHKEIISFDYKQDN